MIFTKSIENKIFLVGITDSDYHGNKTVSLRNSSHTNNISCPPRQDASVHHDPHVTQFFFGDPKSDRRKNRCYGVYREMVEFCSGDWLSPT